MNCKTACFSRIGFRLTAIACLLLAGRTVIAQPSAVGEELLLSDSFEEGTRAPEGWKQGAAIPGVKYVYDRAAASDGKRSLSLQKSANRFFPIAAWMRTVAHTGSQSALKMSAQVKADQARKAILDVTFLDENGQSIKHQWIEYIGQKEQSDSPATHDWKEYSGTADIPAGTKQFVIGLQIYGPGKVWFDELEVRYVKPAGAADAKTSANRIETHPDADQAAIPEPITVQVGTDHSGRYLLVKPAPEKSVPAEGFPLLVVLPGGTGSADFHPFVRRIQQQALSSEFLIAQPLAPPQIVWPTRESLTRQASPTEELLAAVIDDVVENHSVNRQRIYLLAWSSGGPAAYAALLQQDSPIAGALIAMSVFKPEQLPPLAQARGRSVYLLHSPEDPICPYFMAEAAQEQLTASGVRATLVNYDGGHGWHGPVFDQIRDGINWLQGGI